MSKHSADIENPLAIADYAARDFLLANAKKGVLWGDRKVFLGSIPGVDLNDYTTRRTLRALVAFGDIVLGRADLVGAMDQALVESSRLYHDEGSDDICRTWHFLVIAQ